MKLANHHSFRSAALSASIALLLAPPLFAEDAASGGTWSHDSTPGGMSQQQSGYGSDLFNRYDSDHDGKLNPGEYQALVRSLASDSSAMATWSNMADRRVGDVKGKPVYNENNQKIGKIEELVASKQDNRLYAVISVGGFLGIGDTEVTMPLSQLTWRNDRLMAATTATKKEAKAMPRFQETSYRELDDGQTIGSAGNMAGMEPNRQAPSYEALDVNKDDAVDRSEFSAFETWEAGSPAATQPKPREDMPDRP